MEDTNKYMIKYISMFFNNSYNTDISGEIISLLNLNLTSYTINHNGIFINLNTITTNLLRGIYDIIKNNDININESNKMDIDVKQSLLNKHSFIPTHDNIMFNDIDPILLNLSTQYLTI
jgi:hypothetical protein|tara:strand:+ start:154 stop:510 length:357 start_codon:yes stop_codon:yes gene_type:complete